MGGTGYLSGDTPFWPMGALLYQGHVQLPGGGSPMSRLKVVLAVTSAALVCSVCCDKPPHNHRSLKHVTGV
jgi:hypothetical protein